MNSTHSHVSQVLHSILFIAIVFFSVQMYPQKVSAQSVLPTLGAYNYSSYGNTGYYNMPQSYYGGQSYYGNGANQSFYINQNTQNWTGLLTSLFGRNNQGSYYSSGSSYNTGYYSSNPYSSYTYTVNPSTYGSNSRTANSYTSNNGWTYGQSMGSTVTGSRPCARYDAVLGCISN